jgi:hypothetical protein
MNKKIQLTMTTTFHDITRETPVAVIDGFLGIQFLNKAPAASDPKVSAIEIRRMRTLLHDINVTE